MGHSVVNVSDIEGAEPGLAAPDAMTFLAVGARRGAYEPRGPF